MPFSMSSTKVRSRHRSTATSPACSSSALSSPIGLREKPTALGMACRRKCALLPIVDHPPEANTPVMM